VNKFIVPTVALLLALICNAGMDAIDFRSGANIFPDIPWWQSTSYQDTNNAWHWLKKGMWFFIVLFAWRLPRLRHWSEILSYFIICLWLIAIVHDLFLHVIFT